jgi:hypothetical protein
MESILSAVVFLQIEKRNPQYNQWRSWAGCSVEASLSPHQRGHRGTVVQSMNLMLGFPETTGLEQVALFP